MKFIGTTDVVYVDIDTQNAIDKGYNANAAVFSIVSKAAKKFASVPRYVYDNKGNRIDKPAKELSKLLDRPNPYQGQDAFYEQLYACKLLCGETFVWLNRGDTNNPNAPVLEMYVLPVNHVEIIPDPSDLWGCLGYYLVVAGQRNALKKEDVIHWKGATLEFDATTRSHMRGFSPLKAGYKVLQQNNDATDSAVRMYQHDGAKGLLHNKTFDPISPEQKSRIKEVIDSKINTNSVKGMIATVQGDWGYLNFGLSSTDLQLLEGKRMSVQEMCMLFDTPYELFQSETTFANKTEAKKAWISDHIHPACKQWDDEFNRMVLTSFNLQEKVKVASDITDLPEMQEDMEKKVRTLQLAWWLTPNEKRLQMGEEKYDDTYFDEPWIPTGITPLSQASMEVLPDLPTEEDTDQEDEELKKVLNGAYRSYRTV